MKRLAAACVMAFMASPAAADFLCQTVSDGYIFDIDTDARTITFNAHEPMRYVYQVTPVRAIFLNQVTASVEIPDPSPTVGTHWDGTFTLTFGQGDDIVLTQDITSYLNTVEMAFASVEAIMQSITGVPCQIVP